MKLRRQIFLLMLSALATTQGCVRTNSSETLDVEDTSKPGMIKLFNGRDLSGWYTFLEGRGRGHDPKGVFSVADSIIRISGEEWGCITTDEQFKNYRLIVEYKWGDKTFSPRGSNARSGGILIHGEGADGGYDGKWMPSIECQITEGGTGDVLVVDDASGSFSVSSTVRSETSKVFEPAGQYDVTVTGRQRIGWYSRDPDWKDVVGFRGYKDVENPLGDWNTLEVIANARDIKIFLNNQFVNHVFNSTPQEGHIQIQSEGAEIYFRRIDLVPLPEDFRFSYNSDGNNMFGNGEDTPGELYPYVDEVALAGVTSFYISPHFGMTMNFPSQVGDMVGESLSRELEENVSSSVINVRTLVANGHDPLGVMLDRAKAHRMETFVSFRLNEVHGVDQKDSYLFDQFWREHPEWRMGKYGDPVPKVVGGDALPGGLNFAIPQVRAYRLAQLREICERFDITGLELDFQRFPMYFKTGEELAGLQIMTGWIKEVRTMTKEVGKRRGRPLLLTARVLALPEHNTGIGLDPIAWARKGLLDFITVSHVSHNDFPLPIEEYKNLFPKGFPVYASVEVESGMKRYTQIAYPLWQQKVNGIYLFNFFVAKARYDGYRKKVCKSDRDRTTVACGVGKTPPPYDSIRRIGYPVTTRDSLLLVLNRHSNTLSFVDPETFAETQTIATALHPGHIVVMPDQKTAYLSHTKPSSNSISVIDLLSGRQIREIPVDYPGEGPLQGGALSPDGRYVYYHLSRQSGSVILELATQTNEISRTIRTQTERSRMVYVSPNGKHLLTGDILTGHIMVIDRTTGELIKEIPAGKGIAAMAFTPDRKFLWALNQRDGTITIIDMERMEATETMRSMRGISEIRFTANGEKALVVGGRSGEGALSILDVATRKETGRVRVGDYANGVSFSADGKHAFIGGGDYVEPNVSQGVITANQPETEALKKIDVKTLQVVSVLKTGKGPYPVAMWYPPNE